MPKTRDFSLTNQHSKLCINRNNQIINFSPNLVWTPQLLQLVSMYAFFSLSTRHTIWKMAYHGTTRRFEKNMPILFLTLSKNMHQVFRDTHKIESWKNYHENVSKHYCMYINASNQFSTHQKDQAFITVKDEQCFCYEKRLPILLVKDYKTLLDLTKKVSQNSA